MKRTLRLYVGMEAILTVQRNSFIVLMTHALPKPPSHHCKTAALCRQVNKCQSDLFVNGQLGVITAIELEDDNQTPKILYFRPAEAPPNTEPLRITREKSYEKWTSHGMAKRKQFPLIPAKACTVHRLQGATVPDPRELHILLNSEFFAPGRL